MLMKTSHEKNVHLIPTKQSQATEFLYFVCKFSKNSTEKRQIEILGKSHQSLGPISILSKKIMKINSNEISQKKVQKH